MIAITFFATFLTLTALTTAVDNICEEQHEAYTRCVANTQERWVCEDKEVSWYCAAQAKNSPRGKDD